MKKLNSKNKPTINTPNPQKSSPQFPGTIKNSKKINNRYTSINLFSTKSSDQNVHLNSPGSYINRANLLQTPNTSKIFFLKNKFSNSNNHINNSTINMTDSSFKENINPNRSDNNKFLAESNLITKTLPSTKTLATIILAPREAFITSFKYAQNLQEAPKNVFNRGSSLSNEIKARITSEEAKPEQLLAQRSLARTNSLLKLDINSPKIGRYNLTKALSIGSMECLSKYTNGHTKLNSTLNNTSSIMEHRSNVMNDSNDQIMSCRKSNGSSERATVCTQERCTNHPHKKVFIMLKIIFINMDRLSILKW